MCLGACHGGILPPDRRVGQGRSELQRQWKYELRRKFNLDFEVIDSESTFQLRRRLGIDANPWNVFPRIITSMDDLRMPDVLWQFLQASGGPTPRPTATARPPTLRGTC